MTKIHRRKFLRGCGVVFALPFLESMVSAQEAKSHRRRIVAINIGLGLHAPNMIPEQNGRKYELPTYLKLLADYRDQLTVISGTSHPEVGGGHASYKSYLTCAPHPNSAGFRNTISLDQIAAAEFGSETRFASLSLSSSGPGLSWSRSGVEIPTMIRPSFVFRKLFLAGKANEQAQQMQRLQDGQSVLDVVMDKTRRMERTLSGRDRQKLDQYFEAVREAERRLAKAEAWEKKPKPQVKAKPPRDETDNKKIVERMRLMYDVIHLALETDSTRFVTYNIAGMNAVPVIPGVNIDYHNLSHHGKDPEKIAQLTMVESALFQEFHGFLKKLNETSELGGTLLDSTSVLFGSNLGNASSHDTKNMPILLAGGGFQHGQHLAFDPKNNYPLPKLFVSMLQRLGMETDTFGTGTGTMTGLKLLG
ncbi:MAG: DUF1552 domain-containing protein [Planctomycetes bacterium]|nr:DUF1552 domain-containing protein [Planctomycetota bacterium]MCH9724564.1 DUF1552 domain-containing protein [Planctomycetota bacterium]MCH9779418.1 DUF1552 domain-containing protein [Planctomycetota bacterium]MCH9789634.1 DUF1552 domain-containing protein [Planctomycetota bacterium]